MIHRPYVCPEGGWRIQDSSKIPLGVELEVDYDFDEVDARSTIDEELTDIPWLILKNDESLSNGVEIVSHPMGLANHKMKWPPVLRFLREEVGYLSDSNIQGLHIHFSLAQRGSPCILGNFILDNEFNLTRIGGRGPNQYVYWEIGSSHNYVLNPRGPGVFEFRLCRSTVVEEEFMARIELVHAFGSIACLRPMRWGEFWEECGKHPIMYKELLKKGGGE